MPSPLTTPDPWSHLRSFTSARVALGRSGGSLPTRAMLDFQLAHARARDAVHAPFDAERLQGQIERLGLGSVIVNSAAPDRTTYLKHPELGRRLDETGRTTLPQHGSSHAPPDLVILVSDGLSALAVERQTIPLLGALRPMLEASAWSVGPVVLVRYGRVAVEDEVGSILQARLALMLIGERPGLGAPDSLGAYLVHAPRPGLTDASRNCVSNIRPEGLPPDVAARKIQYLLTLSRRHQISGVALKDESGLLATPHPHPTLA